MIEGIAGEFRRGRLVRIEADGRRRPRVPRRLPRRAIAARAGWARSRSSTTPRASGAAGRPYFTTLLDENAAAHIAFGLGFGDTREPGAPPVNRSGIHLDVMIGAPEMDVEAVDARGRKVTLISGGLFAARPLAAQAAGSAASSTSRSPAATC